MRVRDPLDDLLHVVFLLLDSDAMLGDNQMRGLSQTFVDNGIDLFVLECISDGMFSTGMAVIRSSCVASVDGEELALYVWLEVVDPFDGLDLGGPVGREGRLVDDPFVKGLDLDVEASVGILTWDNTIDS